MQKLGEKLNGMSEAVGVWLKKKNNRQNKIQNQDQWSPGKCLFQEALRMHSLSTSNQPPAGPADEKEDRGCHWLWGLAGSSRAFKFDHHR